MANGHVEIHDPISNHNNPKNGSNCDRTSTSDESDMEDTEEYRMLMAYAKRRRPKEAQDSPVIPNGSTDKKETPAKTEQTVTTTTTTTTKKKEQKKTKGWKRVLHILKCVKPQTEEEPQQNTETQRDTDEHDNVANRCNDNKVGKNEEKLEDVVNTLTKLANEIPFIPPELETDSSDNVERAIGLILRESGDRLNEQELKNVAMLKEVFWDYGFFKSVISSLLTRMGLKSLHPDSPGPHASPKTQIAVTFEATSRLSAMDTLPMSQLLGFGAKYLNENHRSWVMEQGGYEAAFESDNEDDDDDD